MKRSVKCLMFVLVVSILCSPAIAGRVWYYSEISSEGADLGGSSALAMSNGNIWPTVATNGGVAMMTPAGWVKGSVGYMDGSINAATAADGTVGFVDTHGKVAMLTKSGWSSSYVGGDVAGSTSIAFDGNSRAAVLHSGYDYEGPDLILSVQTSFGWQSSTVVDSQGTPVMSAGASIAFDSYNQSVIAFDSGTGLRFGTKGPLNGHQWSLTDSGSESPYTGNSKLDLALSANDIPFVAYADGSMLSYATYDRQTDSIISSNVDTLSTDQFGEDCFAIGSDSEGGIGIAYVASYEGANVLSYAHNAGDGWEIDRLRDAIATESIGLAYDEEGNPVISYIDVASGSLMLAYDPIVTPEPASIALFGLGALAVARR